MKWIFGVRLCHFAEEHVLYFQIKTLYIVSGIMVNLYFINYYFKAILCCFFFPSGHSMMLVFQQNLLGVGDMFN